MRIRSILPKFWESEDVGRMDWSTRLVFIGLWSYADDNGVGRDVDALIAADLFPFDLSRDSRETFARVADALATLAAGGQIVRYSVDGKPLLFVTKWDEYQRVDRPAKDRYPRPTTPDAVIHETVATPSRESRDTLATGEGEKGRRGEGEKGRESGASQAKRARALAPDWRPRQETVDTIRSECPRLDLTAEHRKFADYYAATGKPMKDWDATWRNWMRRATEGGSTRTGRPTRQQETDDLFAAAMQRALATDAASNLATIEGIVL